MTTEHPRTADTLRLPAHRNPVPTHTRLRTRRLPVAAYVTILLVLPIAVLTGAQATGWWVPTGHTVPATALGAEALGVARTNGGPGGPGGPGGDGSGGTTAGGPATPLNPHDIKGSMTVQQILDAFPEISAADIFRLFGVPANTPTSAQLKTLAQDGNGFEVADLREWLEAQGGR